MSGVDFRKKFFEAFQNDPDQLAELLADLASRVGTVERSSDQRSADLEGRVDRIVGSGAVGSLLPDGAVIITPTINPDEVAVSYTFDQIPSIDIGGRLLAAPVGTVTIPRPTAAYEEFLGQSSMTFATAPAMSFRSFQLWDTHQVLVDGSPPPGGTYTFDNDTGILSVPDVSLFPEFAEWTILGDLTTVWAVTIAARAPADPEETTAELVALSGSTRFPDHSKMMFADVPTDHVQIGVVYDVGTASAIVDSDTIDESQTQRRGEAQVIGAIDNHDHSGFPGFGPPVVLTVRIPVFEAIAKSQVVASDSLGRAIVASSDDPDRWNVQGVSLADYSPGETAVVQYGGAIEDPSWTWNLSISKWLYVGIGGAITQTPPTSGLVHQIGRPSNTTNAVLSRGARIVI